MRQCSTCQYVDQPSESAECHPCRPPAMPNWTPRQPAATGIEAAVCADIAARQRLGIAKYGTSVADNPLALRAWLQHALEECYDLAVYLKRAIAEIDHDRS